MPLTWKNLVEKNLIGILLLFFAHHPLLAFESPPNDRFITCEDNLRKTDAATWRWTVNTSNPAKKAEFRSLFARYGVELGAITGYDLAEIDASPLQVVVHKASLMPAEGMIVEDSSLDVAGAKVGVHLKWLLDQIPSYLGRKASLTALIAFRVGNFIYVYRGQVEGRLVQPKGPGREGSPLNRYFQPIGSDKTLAEDLSENHDVRALAFKAMLNKDYVACVPLLRHWWGNWQPRNH